MFVEIFTTTRDFNVLKAIITATLQEGKIPVIIPKKPNSLDRLYQVMNHTYQVTKEQLKSPDNSAEISVYRQVFAYCAVELCGLHINKVAKIINRHRTTVNYALKECKEIPHKMILVEEIENQLQLNNNSDE